MGASNESTVPDAPSRALDKHAADLQAIYKACPTALVQGQARDPNARYLATQRGIGGGFILGRTPETIRLGDIVRLGEETETVIDCREDKTRLCRLHPACQLKGILDEAAKAFFDVLDDYTLADLIQRPSRMRFALGLDRPRSRKRSRLGQTDAEYEI